MKTELLLSFILLNGVRVMALPMEEECQKAPNRDDPRNSVENSSFSSSRRSNEEKFSSCQEEEPIDKGLCMQFSIHEKEIGFSPTLATENSLLSEKKIAESGTMSGVPIRSSSPNTILKVEEGFFSESNKGSALDARNIHDVTFASLDSIPAQPSEKDPLVVLAAVHDQLSTTLTKIVEELHLHPEKNQITDLLPAYSEIKTAAQEQLAFVTLLPVNEPKREALITKTADIIFDLLSACRYSSPKGLQKAFRVDSDASYNINDALQSQLDLTNAVKVLQTDDTSIVKVLALKRQERADRKVITAMKKADGASDDEPYASAADTALTTAIKTQQRLRGTPPFTNAHEAREAALHDLLDLMHQALRIGDRTMHLEDSSPFEL